MKESYGKWSRGKGQRRQREGDRRFSLGFFLGLENEDIEDIYVILQEGEGEGKWRFLGRALLGV